MLLAVVLVPLHAVAENCPESESSVIRLSAPSGPVYAARSAAILEDPGATFDYEKILAADEAGKFRRHCRADLTPPTAGGAHDAGVR